MSEQTIKIKFFVSTDCVGSKCEDVIEMPKEEWETASPQERDEMMRDYAFNFVEWGYKEVCADD